MDPGADTHVGLAGFHMDTVPVGPRRGSRAAGRGGRQRERGAEDAERGDDGSAVVGKKDMGLPPDTCGDERRR
ncbi:hypothetical protein SHKM778_30950 [Streptomyces sp. KM77-8]|uniref:Uncharacterized protein n=1 Tax=Streptomyces haneummycinicus TaxID=3074435 RepID=A0AAT9HHB0_9ACTN